MSTLFSFNSANKPATTSGGLFGNQPQQQQQQQPSGAFGFGQQQQQQQQQPSIFQQPVQQVSQQQIQQQQLSQQQLIEQQQYLNQTQQPSRFSKYKLSASSNASDKVHLKSEDNSNRRIPTKLVKRTGKQINSLNDDELNEIANPSQLPFQNNLTIKNALSLLTSDETDADLNESDYFNNAPPRRSLWDFHALGKDDDLSNSSNSITYTDKLLKSDPTKYNNAFAKPGRRRSLTELNNDNIATSTVSDNNGDDSLNHHKDEIVTKGLGASSKPANNLPFVTNVTYSKPIAPAKKDVFNSLTGESAVIIFGYDDEMFEELILYFDRFGKILENFNIADNRINTSYIASAPFVPINDSLIADQSILAGSGSTKPVSTFSGRINNTASMKYSSRIADLSNSTQKKSYPIFIGKQWVKITYDNIASAIRALRENGISLDGSNAVIGVIPYTKESLEALLHSKIPNDEDVGGDSFTDFNATTVFAPAAVSSEASKKLFPGSDIATLLQYSHNGATSSTDGSSVKLKDGKDLFKNNVKKEKAANGSIVGTLMKYMLGSTDV
ncbi:hypothetical protein B5S31_g548 [[Candida] boidinii]|nr:hypothetical protein B5S31_g548 [[Candida] boidinii]